MKNVVSGLITALSLAFIITLPVTSASARKANTDGGFTEMPFTVEMPPLGAPVPGVNEPCPCYMAVPRALNEYRSDIEITGFLPVITTEDAAFSARLNGLIGEKYRGIISRASGRYARMYVDYRIYEYGGVVSVLLLGGPAKGSAAEHFGGVSFRCGEGWTYETVTLDGVLGPNGVKIANGIITEAIKGNVNAYHPNFAGIKSDQDFYVEDGTLYVLFDKHYSYAFAVKLFYP